MEKHIVLVTGMSGAGKSSAMSALEDMGYHCIDNYPVALIEEFARFLTNCEEEQYQNIALATSASDYIKFVQYFKNVEAKIQVVYLDANDETLLLRYKFTRRNHPLIIRKQAISLEEAIEKERDLFKGLIDHNHIHIDTSKLNTSNLKDVLIEKLALDQKRTFAISFMSFGFKHGIPRDADFVFDARFLPNPFYLEDLKYLTGEDQAVYDYVMSFDESKEYVQQIINCLDVAFREYDKQNRSHICVAIGCTGGHHRSVTLTNYLYKYYCEHYTCYKAHRDLLV